MNIDPPISSAPVRNPASTPVPRAGEASPAFDPNLGIADRAARMLTGFAAMSHAVNSLETLWALLGIGLFATGLLGLCPFYPIFGWCTRRRST